LRFYKYKQVKGFRMNKKKKSDKLKAYQKKRDFDKTTEPEGKEATKGDKYPRFVVQKHDASSLHYDFRLEMDDVLKSWAVPKGPSTDPSDKRMAIHTEDHPVDYIDFEGTIPEDQYGGGTIIVWDGGAYENLRENKEGENVSMADSFEDGKVEVWLHGKKIKGGYVLIRTGGKKERQWLLKKMKDEEADRRRNPVSTEPESILSGKKIEDIEKEMEGKDEEGQS
jgi:DNA ligase D-like protein (predicted 3'-phosphoesterase)